MKNKALLSSIILASIFLLHVQAYTTSVDTTNRRETVQEEIWALEEGYFTNLYKANYEGVLALVHSQFLGWPGSVAQPMDKEESARFMRKLITVAFILHTQD
ncbi:MAG: hypothetical protein MZV70_43570 [Desulfobacterales bacterium]|nr:hypothetical protein [Desulfobacterales bacterium]